MTIGAQSVSAIKPIVNFFFSNSAPISAEATNETPKPSPINFLIIFNP